MIAEGFLLTETVLKDQTGRLTEDAAAALNQMLRFRIPFVILTQRSAPTRQQMAQELQEQGCPHLRETSFYSTAMAAIDEIVEKMPQHRCAAYIGGRGMRELLRMGGFSLDMDRADWLFIGQDREAGFMDYCYALKIALKGAVIVETDGRTVYLDEQKEPLIGSGSIVKMIQENSGAHVWHADMPSDLVIQRAARYLGMTANRLLLVTPGIQREMEAGEKAGIRTAVVTAHSPVNPLTASIAPTYVAEDLMGLLTH